MTKREVASLAFKLAGVYVLTQTGLSLYSHAGFLVSLIVVGLLIFWGLTLLVSSKRLAVRMFPHERH